MLQENTLRGFCPVCYQLILKYHFSKKYKKKYKNWKLEIISKRMNISEIDQIFVFFGAEIFNLNSNHQSNNDKNFIATRPTEW